MSGNQQGQGPDPRNFGEPFTFGDILRGVDITGLEGLGAPGAPQPVSPQPGGAPDSPWQRQAAIEAGIPYRRVPIWPPFANLARDPSVVYMVRLRPIFFGGNGVAAGALPQQPLQFSQPTIVFARTAAAFRADDVGLPVGRHSLETFSAFIQRTNGDALDGGTTPIIARAIFGDGSNPALYAANGLFFNNGTNISVNVTTLLANVLVHIVLWTIEEYGNPTATRK